MDIAKIGVFYDGNFLLHSSNYYNYVHAIRKRISIDGLQRYMKKYVAQYLKKEEHLCRISQSHYYRGRLNAADALSRGNQLYNDRVFDDILMSDGVDTHYLPLRNCGSRREESGTNVSLSVSALELAIKGEIDVAVLVVGDSDYLPLLRKLSKYNVLTIVLGWDFEYVNEDGVRMSTKTSQELRSNADVSLCMHELIEVGLKRNDELVEQIFVGCVGMK